MASRSQILNVDKARASRLVMLMPEMQHPSAGHVCLCLCRLSFIYLHSGSFSGLALCILQVMCAPVYSVFIYACICAYDCPSTQLMH